MVACLAWSKPWVLPCTKVQDFLVCRNCTFFGFCNKTWLFSFCVPGVLWVCLFLQLQFCRFISSGVPSSKVEGFSSMSFLTKDLFLSHLLQTIPNKQLKGEYCFWSGPCRQQGWLMYSVCFCSYSFSWRLLVCSFFQLWGLSYPAWAGLFPTEQSALWPAELQWLWPISWHFRIRPEQLWFFLWTDPKQWVS